MRKLVKKQSYLRKLQTGGLIPKFQEAGKLPIGNQAQYDHVTTLYQILVDNGIKPQAALDIVNQKVAEKGWSSWATGDNKKFNNPKDFVRHIIDWHTRMYPDSLKANNFDQYYKGIMITPKYKYNPRGEAYRQELLETRPGVKKRINHYRAQKGLSPLVYNIDAFDSNFNDFYIT